MLEGVKSKPPPIKPSPIVSFYMSHYNYISLLAILKGAINKPNPPALVTAAARAAFAAPYIGALAINGFMIWKNILSLISVAAVD